MSTQDIQAIEQADARRCAATIAKDAATLRELFGDDLLYVHSSATAEDKALYIERACTGFYDVRRHGAGRRRCAHPGGGEVRRQGLRDPLPAGLGAPQRRLADGFLAVDPDPGRLSASATDRLLRTPE